MVRRPPAGRQTRSEAGRSLVPAMVCQVGVGGHALPGLSGVGFVGVVGWGVGWFFSPVVVCPPPVTTTITKPLITTITTTTTTTQPLSTTTTTTTRSHVCLQVVVAHRVSDRLRICAANSGPAALYGVEAHRERVVSDSVHQDEGE